MPGFARGCGIGTVKAIAVLGALRGANAPGEGQFVDVAMQDAVISLLTIFGGSAFPAGCALRRATSTAATSSLVYTTSDDRYVTLAAFDDTFWTRFCDAVEQPDLKTLLLPQPAERPVLEEVRGPSSACAPTPNKGGLTEHDPLFRPVLGLAEVFRHPHVTARRAGAGHRTSDCQAAADRPSGEIPGPPPLSRCPPAPELGTDTDHLQALGIAAAG